MPKSTHWWCVAVFASALACAQSSTNISVNVSLKNFTFNVSNAFGLSQTGSVGALGYGTLIYTSSTTPLSNGTYQGPVQIEAGLYFNELDSIVINYTENDPNFDLPQSFTMSGGTITGGTGAYAGASGSLDLNIAKDGGPPATFTTATTTGSGTVTVGGATTPLVLSNFSGLVLPFWRPSSSDTPAQLFLGTNHDEREPGECERDGAGVLLSERSGFNPGGIDDRVQ